MARGTRGQLTQARISNAPGVSRAIRKGLKAAAGVGVFGAVRMVKRRRKIKRAADIEKRKRKLQFYGKKAARGGVKGKRSR